MRGPPQQKALQALLDFYRRDDLPGFIREYHRLYGPEPWAFDLWCKIALASGAYGPPVEDGPDDN